MYGTYAQVTTVSYSLYCVVLPCDHSIHVHGYISINHRHHRHLRPLSPSLSLHNHLLSKLCAFYTEYGVVRSIQSRSLQPQTTDPWMVWPLISNPSPGFCCPTYSTEYIRSTYSAVASTYALCTALRSYIPYRPTYVSGLLRSVSLPHNQRRKYSGQMPKANTPGTISAWSGSADVGRAWRGMAIIAWQAVGFFPSPVLGFHGLPWRASTPIRRLSFAVDSDSEGAVQRWGTTSPPHSAHIHVYVHMDAVMFARQETAHHNRQAHVFRRPSRHKRTIPASHTNYPVPRDSDCTILLDARVHRRYRTCSPYTPTYMHTYIQYGTHGYY